MIVDPSAKLLEQLQRSLRENGESLSVSVLIGDAVSEALGGEQVESTTGAISKSHLTKIKKWMRKEVDAERIHVFPTLMITEAATRNMVIYTAKSQKKSVRAWEGVPILYNANAEGGFLGGGDHALKANSQIGRIYQAQVVTTPNGDVGTLGWWYAVEGISDDLDAVIEKCETGIHREGSIHVTVPEGVICSICKDAFSKCMENSGEYHYPGETYKKPKGNGKETCFMSTGEGVLGPLEYSLVACPGSTAAHIMPDDEVSDYKPVNLREALGGSREAIDTLITDRQENIVDYTEARKKLLEAALAASVSVEDFIADAANASVIKEANVTTETIAEAFTVEQLAEAKKKSDDNDEDESSEDDDDADEKKNAKAKESALFDGDCPVCLRGAESALPTDEAEAVKKLREQFQQQVTVVVEAANTKIAAAETARDAAVTSASEFSELFAYIVAETADLAIASGHKQSCERDAYLEELTALSSKGVKAVREAFKTSSKAVAPEAKREKLVESMTQRAKREMGSTTVFKTEAGTTRSNPQGSVGRKARFAAK